MTARLTATASVGLGMQHLQLEDAEIAYHRSGDGPTLLLLHGATSSSSHDWSALLPFLGGYQVIALDHRAHGASSGEIDELSTATLLRDIEACVNQLGVKRYAVLAASHGGLPAVRLADRHPDQVTALVLLGYAPWVPDVLDGGGAPIESRWADELSALHVDRSRQHWRRLLQRMMADRVGDAGASADIAGRLSCPTLFTFGDRDPFVPLSVAPKLVDLVPDVEVFVVPGAGHQPQRKAPMLVASGVRRFLASRGWGPDALAQPPARQSGAARSRSPSSSPSITEKSSSSSMG